MPCKQESLRCVFGPETATAGETSDASNLRNCGSLGSRSERSPRLHTETYAWGGSAMQITAVTSYPVKVGFRNQFIVKIDTDEGISGVGEGGMSGRELAMAGMVEHLSRWLIGEDPGRIEHLWQTCY